MLITDLDRLAYQVAAQAVRARLWEGSESAHIRQPLAVARQAWPQLRAASPLRLELSWAAAVLLAARHLLQTTLALCQ